MNNNVITLAGTSGQDTGAIIRASYKVNITCTDSIGQAKSKTLREIPPQLCPKLCQIRGS